MAGVMINILLMALNSSFEIVKHVPFFHRVIETRVEVWKNEKSSVGTQANREVFPHLFRVLSNLYECFYNSMETWKTYFLFLFRDEKT